VYIVLIYGAAWVGILYLFAISVNNKQPNLRPSCYRKHHSHS